MNYHKTPRGARTDQTRVSKGDWPLDTARRTPRRITFRTEPGEPLAGLGNALEEAPERAC